MIRKQGIAEIHSGIKQMLIAKTEYDCLDFMPTDRTEPFYRLQAVEKIAGETKTGFNEKIMFYIHIFPQNTEDINVEYEMIRQAEQALTVSLPDMENVKIVSQQYQGMERITEDVDIAKHTVLKYLCNISYGFTQITETE